MPNVELIEFRISSSVFIETTDTRRFIASLTVLNSLWRYPRCDFFAHGSTIDRVPDLARNHKYAHGFASVPDHLKNNYERASITSVWNTEVQLYYHFSNVCCTILVDFSLTSPAGVVMLIHAPLSAADTTPEYLLNEIEIMSRIRYRQFWMSLLRGVSTFEIWIIHMPGAAGGGYRACF